MGTGPMYFGAQTVLRRAAETPAKAQNTIFLQEQLLMLTQVGPTANTVSPAENLGHQLSQAVPTCVRGQSRGA